MGVYWRKYGIEQPALKITGVQRSNTAENRSLNAQDGVTPVTLNGMIFD